MKKVFRVCIFIVLPLFSFAQKQANNWYFGVGQGITFNSGTPAKIYGGSLVTLEGNATISDEQGNLLFYTDGMQVWNKEHALMPNGSELKGHWSTTQAALIVPKPADTNTYYIFTSDEEAHTPPNEGVHYSEVNLCLEKGLGDVVTGAKNIKILNTSSEKLAAVKHANGIDYWLLTHEVNSDKFHAFQITSSGVNHTPVISSIGSYHEGPYQIIGQMKISPDGKRLAVARSSYQFFEVFDFDSQTGEISNPLILSNYPPLPPDTPKDGFYGVEFSLDGSKVYVTGHGIRLLMQYDLEAGDEQTINASRQIISDVDINNPNEEDRGFGSLQLGPDGKIYVANFSGFGYFGISVIHQPNQLGLACSFQDRVLSWGQHELSTHFPSDGRNWGFIGLPSFTSNFFHSAPIIFHTFDCLSPIVQFTLTRQSGTISEEQINSIQWTFADEASGRLEYYDQLAPLHTFHSAGKHLISAQIGWSDGHIDKIQKEIYIPEEIFAGAKSTLGEDLLACAGDKVILDASEMGELIQWQDGSSLPTFEVTTSGTYWVTVCRQGCIAKDSISVIFEACDNLAFIPNVITPNADGFNDQFRIEGLEKGLWSLTIYNRYGRVLYSTPEYKNDWDGFGLPAGNYYYFLQNAKDKKTYKGWMSLLR